MDRPPQHERPSRRLEVTVLGCLLFVSFVLVLLRAGQESSLWSDELYSLTLTGFSFGDLLRASSTDFNPPGYYFLLKLWAGFLRRIGFEGVFAARSLNALTWCLVPACAWLLGRSLGSSGDGLRLTVVLAPSAALAVQAQDARAYGTLVPLCFLAATIAACMRFGEVSERFKRLAPWLFGAAGALALWMHALAGPLLLIAHAVLVLPCFFRRRSRRWASQASQALAAAMLLYLPWIGFALDQASLLSRSAPAWMTPPSLSNLATVFLFWIPAGRLGPPLQPDNPPLALGSALLSLAALAVGLSGLRGKRNAGAAAGASLLATAAVFVLALWLAARYTALPVFHGPRYPALAAPLWIAGLAWMVRSATRPALQRALLGVWVIFSFTCQGVLIQRQASWGLEHWKLRPEATELLPAPSEDLFVLPAALIPYHLGALEQLVLRPVTELPCSAAARGGGDVSVLELSNWPGLLRGEEAVAWHRIRSGDLGLALRTAAVPAELGYYTLHRLGSLSIDPEACTDVFRSEFARRHEGLLVLPEDQLGAGWSFLEVQRGNRTFRWTVAEEVELSAPGPLDAGIYELAVHGFRREVPPGESELVLDLPGAPPQRQRIAGGGFTVRQEFEVRRDRRRFRARLAHPLAPNADPQRPALGISFLGASVRKLEPLHRP